MGTVPLKRWLHTSYLADALLLVQALLRQLLPFYLHAQTHNIFSADGDELLGLCNLLFIVHDKKRHTEQDGTEFFHCFLKLANCGELVAQLQSLDQVIKL